MNWWLVIGSVRILCQGQELERLLQGILKKNIRIKECVRTPSGMQFQISVPDFFLCRKWFRKTHTKVRILEKKGLVYWCRKNKNQSIPALAILLLSLSLFISTFFIWRIELSEISVYSREQIYAFLENQGVSPGMKKSVLDCKKTEQLLSDSFPKISWISIYIDGGVLNVSILEEKEEALFLYETDNYKEDVTPVLSGKDLVAPLDATIVSMVVRSGIPKVKIGEQVQKGTVLVSATVDAVTDFEENKDFMVSVDADVELEHEKTFHIDCPFQVKVEQLENSFQIFHFFIQFGQKKLLFSYPEMPFSSYQRTETIHQLHFMENNYLPIYFGEEIYTKKQKNVIQYSEEECRSLLENDVIKIIANLEEKGVQIIEKNVTIESEYDKMTLDCTLKVREFAEAVN